MPNNKYLPPYVQSYIYYITWWLWIWTSISRTIYCPSVFSVFIGKNIIYTTMQVLHQYLLSNKHLVVVFSALNSGYSNLQFTAAKSNKNETTGFCLQPASKATSVQSAFTAQKSHWNLTRTNKFLTHLIFSFLFTAKDE